MGKGKILDELKIKKFDMRTLSPFPTLEKVLEDFCDENELPKPIRVRKTSQGLIADFEGEGYVVISSKGSRNNLNPRLQPFIGGDGSAMYTSQEVNYKLEGKLSGKKVRLKTRMVYNETYESVPTNLPYPMVQTTFEKTERNKTHMFRDDNNQDYWFLRGPFGSKNH